MPTATAPLQGVTAAWLGEGWRAILGGPGAVLVEDAVQTRLVMTLPPGDEDARAEAAAGALAWIDRQIAAGRAVAGALSYELGAALERVEGGAVGTPDVALVAFSPDALHPWAPGERPRPTRPATPPTPAALDAGEAGFRAGVERALEGIAAGRYYQLNMTTSCEVPAPAWLSAQPLHLALAQLAAAQEVPYAMALSLPGGAAFGLSMERCLRLSAEGLASSRPIKGTAERGADPLSDAARRAALVGSEKERAENAMIVDMVRNDLARVAEIGSVSLAALFETVPYRTLWHLESEVVATVRQPPSATLTALLPPASVTGCPKVSAMRAIAELEPGPRGLYCGVQGLWLPDGRAELAVAIRPVIVQGGRARLSVGAGIVADSDPGREWRETRLKARGALAGLGPRGDGAGPESEEGA